MWKHQKILSAADRSIQVSRKSGCEFNSTDDPGFGPAYAAALNGELVHSPAPVPKSKASATETLKGSLRELCAAYTAFLTKDTTLSEGTKYTLRRHLKAVCREISIGCLATFPSTKCPRSMSSNCSIASETSPKHRMTGGRRSGQSASWTYFQSGRLFLLRPMIWSKAVRWA